MELAGNMDGKSARDSGRTGYDVYDSADDEVHFSRELLSQQLPFAQAGALGINSAIGSPDTSLDYYMTSYGPASPPSDQARSNRLLSSISSRLRRGSNYLVGPKLASQYLLGITIRSWSQFFNTSLLTKVPCNTQQLTRRLANNLSYFQGNYLCVLLVLIVYCILTSPLLLLALLAYLVALYTITVRSATGQQLCVAGFRPSLQQQYSFITLLSLPLLWVAGAPSAIFWVIGASFVVVGLHASMYNSLCDIPAYQLAGMERSPSSSQSPATLFDHCPRQYLPEPSKESYNATASFTTSASGVPYSTARPHEPRTLDASVISQDFAGLGRVYEI